MGKAKSTNASTPGEHLRAGELSGAQKNRQQVAVLAADNVDALIRLGREAWRRGDINRAVACFREGLSLDPGNPDLHNNLGVVCKAVGGLEDAVRHFREALRLKPDHPVAHYHLGNAFALQGKLADAVASYRTALRTTGDKADVWYRLGCAQRRLGELEQAVVSLNKALRMDPGSAEALYHLGLALKTQGRRREALESFQRARRVEPGSVYALAADTKILVEKDGLGNPSAGRPNVRRVAFNLQQAFHYAMLRPVFDAFRGHHICLLTPDPEELIDFNPEVMIVADSQAGSWRRLLPRAIFVYTRHGLTSKNHACHGARLADYVCVTSETNRKWFIENGGMPRRGFWMTGYVQMDPLFRADPLPLPFELPADRKRVLYAPTYNPLLSSAPMLGDRLVDLIRDSHREVAIVIKPHPLIPERQPGWMSCWRALAEAHPYVYLVEDAASDLMPFLKAADLLISDASSAIFAFLAVDRPMILITNPDRFKDPHFDPNGIEWRARDVGEEIHDVALLSPAVDRALGDPRRFADRRAYYREQLFGTLTDGRAAERILEEVNRLKI